jgi:hypothetical protein
VTRRFCICLALVVLGVAGADARQRDAGAGSPGELFGTWTGTWDGAGSGGFELTLEKGADGAATGRVSVTGEPTYKATLKTLSLDGGKLAATYDFPPDDAIEVVLTATFDGNTAKGTWTARQKAGGSEVATGTWTVSRK